MGIYTNFSTVYDALINDVDYKKICENMLSVCGSYNHTPKLVLDAACGTGNFTRQLCEADLDVIGVDMSPDMLAVAQKKLGDKATLLCQDICELDLYGSVDTAFCMLDGLNHITDKVALKKAVSKIAHFLEPGGLFIFDVNTVYKHKKVLGSNVFIEDKGDIYLIWRNRVMPRNVVSITLDFFVNSEKTYTRFREEFDQRAYSHAEIKGILKSEGLQLLECRDFFTNEAVKKHSEKVVYVARKST